MGKIAKYLNQLTVGNVFDNPEVLEEFATDQSVLRIKPKFVAFPESTDDIRKLMRFFSQLAVKNIKVAVTARGSGCDTTGADLSNGIVISTRRLNKLLEIDPRERLVHVQSGITLKELNTALSVSGLTIPVEGHDNDTIGGLISNAPVDGLADKYGGIQDYVERIEAVLSNGECLQTTRLRKYALAKKAAEKSVEGAIYQKVSKLIHDEKDHIKEAEEDKHGMAGYPEIANVYRRDTMDLAPIFFGAQGTLGIITEVILKAAPLKSKSARVIATFKEVGPALRYMKDIKSLHPDKLDMYDLHIVMEAREAGKNLDGVIKKLEDGIVVYASFTDWVNNRVKKISSLRSNYPRTTKFIFEKPENKKLFDEFENSLVNYLSHVKNGERASILTDFYIPDYNLERFMRDLKILGGKLDLDLALYGSYATSIYSLRPKFNLEDEEFRKKATTFLRAGAYVIDRQGGKLAGGTPEGRLKAVVTNEAMNDSMKDFYAKIKEIFDPNGILNPDVKLGAVSKFTLTHFRDQNCPKI